MPAWLNRIQAVARGIRTDSVLVCELRAAAGPASAS